MNAPYTKSEFVLLGDLNWDMLKPLDQVLKQWDSLNISQIITNPTRYDSKHPEKAALLDVILTNNPDSYPFGVFCNDLSDHCFTACVRNGCSVKQPVLICHRRLLKNI
jgi:D-alanyl-D-alanine dipeptidase